MKNSHLALALFTLFAFGLYSCKKYVNHSVRKSYTDVNKVLHADASQNPFFKIHFKNGNVSTLEYWHITSSKDSLKGEGALYDLNRNNIEDGQLSFAIEDMAIIETNNLDQLKSKDSERIALLSILTAANVILDLVCLANPKACFGSCPTFYVNGDDMIHGANAEGFSNAISPALEYGDIDALQHSTSKERFQLTMKNEAFETHMVNELALFAVPKSRDENVFHDNDGNYYKAKEIVEPSSASAEGKDIRSLICGIDETEYFSLTDSFDLTKKEEVILEFENMPNERHGIVINHRQTLLTTFLLYSGLSYMGDEVGDYFAKIETNRYIKKKLGSPFKKLGGIKMFVWDPAKRKWKFVEELYETGPIAENLIISPIWNMQPQGGKMKIKLEMSKGLWRIDHIGLSSIENPVEPLKVHPSEIDIVEGGAYFPEDVSADDEEYLISFPGDEYNLQFDFPKLPYGEKYELFLSAIGYYLEWMRSSWLEGKDLPKLKRMLMHDRQTWRELAIEFKSMEHEMESVFWSSKYPVLEQDQQNQ